MKSQSTAGILWAGLASTIGAALLAVIMLLLAQKVFGITPHISIQPDGSNLMELDVMRTIGVSVFAGALATIMYWVVTRVTKYPNVIYAVLSFIVLVASFVPVFMLAISGAEQLVLCLLHVIVGTTLAGTFISMGCSSCCCGMCASDEWESYCDDEECEDCVVLCDECGDEDCDNCESCARGEGGCAWDGDEECDNCEDDDDCECECDGDCDNCECEDGKCKRDKEKEEDND